MAGCLIRQRDAVLMPSPTPNQFPALAADLLMAIIVSGAEWGCPQLGQLWQRVPLRGRGTGCQCQGPESLIAHQAATTVVGAGIYLQAYLQKSHRDYTSALSSPYFLCFGLIMVLDFHFLCFWYSVSCVLPQEGHCGCH